MGKKKDVKALIKQAKPPEKVVPVCLRGDLNARWQELERDLKQAQAQPADRLVGNAAVLTIAQEMERLREEMQGHSVDFRLRALPKRPYNAMLAEHPPRKDNNVDQMIGYNLDTFSEALLPACVVEPDLDDEDWAALVGTDDEPGVLTSGQYDELVQAATELNRGRVDVPFSRDAWRILHSSDSASKPPAGSGFR